LAIVFTDIVGSTALYDKLGDQRMRVVRRAHFTRSTELLSRNDGRFGVGREIKNIGDAVLAVFGTAEAAFDYAYALQRNPGHPELEVRGVRAGIHIGTVDIDENDVFGIDVAFAARIVHVIEDAEIWLSEFALAALRKFRAEEHDHLRWKEHSGLAFKGLSGYHRLWSLALTGSGRSLHEIVIGDLLPVRLGTVPNIPEGMVPRFFIGREASLTAITTALRREEGRVVITALHGLRGVGKTVLAAAYAEQHQGDYRAIWWLRAEAEAGMRADLAMLGVRLGWVPEYEKEGPAVATTLNRLAEEGEGILLIYDNAVSAETVRAYLPRRGAARVLITSNSPVWHSIAEPVEIQPWPPDTGAKYLTLRTRGREEESSAAKDLSEVLGGLPLALEQAGAYCERLGISLAEYKRYFESAPVPLLDATEDAPATYRDKLTVAKTFTLAIREAAKLHPAAEPLIVHAALLAPDAIPLFVFAEGREQLRERISVAPWWKFWRWPPPTLGSRLSDEGLNDAIAALRAFALVNRETIPDERDPSISTPTIRLHRLVRQIAALRRRGNNRLEALGSLTKAVAAVYPSNVYNDPKGWPRARRLDVLARALVADHTVLLESASLMNEVALYQHAALAAYVPARYLFERALLIRKQRLGEDDLKTVSCANDLARLLRDQHEFTMAHDLYKYVLSTREKVLGNEHPDTATGMNNLAISFRDLKDFLSARPLFERALSIREKILPADHPDVAQSLHNLATLLYAFGDLPEARNLYERALSIQEKVLGLENASTALTLNNLAALLRNSRHYADAQRRYLKALSVREKVFGPDHPDTAQTLYDLALIVKSRRDIGAAKPLFERALSIRQKKLGHDHPDTKQTLDELREIETMMSRKMIQLLNRAKKKNHDVHNSAATEIRRNQPCPCGSGRRYKHCHGLI
jgi:class 3 adenylate cyclase/tetratricopeptide (TPR) repeat protein